MLLQLLAGDYFERTGCFLVHQPHEEVSIVVVVLLRVDLVLEKDLTTLSDQHDVGVV